MLSKTTLLLTLTLLHFLIKPHLAVNHAKPPANIKRSIRKLDTTSPLNSKPKQMSLPQHTSCKHTGQHKEGYREHTGTQTEE